MFTLQPSHLTFPTWIVNNWPGKNITLIKGWPEELFMRREFFFRWWIFRKLQENKYSVWEHRYLGTANRRDSRVNAVGQKALNITIRAASQTTPLLLELEYCIRSMMTSCGATRRGRYLRLILTVPWSNKGDDDGGGEDGREHEHRDADGLHRDGSCKI